LMGAHPADGYPARRPAKPRDIWTFLSNLGVKELFGILLAGASHCGDHRDSPRDHSQWSVVWSPWSVILADV
jgi:hypothetical protein